MSNGHSDAGARDRPQGSELTMSHGHSDAGAGVERETDPWGRGD